MQASAPAKSAPSLLNTVPQITAMFWLVKILSTGAGETGADFLIEFLGPPIAVILAVLGLAATLTLQFRARRYVVWVYWSAVMMVSVSGTIIADVVAFVIGVPLWLSSLGFLGLLALTLTVWRWREGTLSIHHIDTPRRAAFYWITVLVTFTLGTAVGDYLAVIVNLGWVPTGLVFAGLILLPALLRARFGLAEVAAFWWAYTMTRPLGASFADWFVQPPIRGGLDINSGFVTLVLAVCIVACVGWLAQQQRTAAGLPT
ncbi:hypothetical protein [Deinococcus sp.]|uniref:COG4705 family protein n=1 Tax=Deinococcus sp. TaxID=47478 RepID=UPI003B5A2362